MPGKEYDSISCAPKEEDARHCDDNGPHVIWPSGVYIKGLTGRELMIVSGASVPLSLILM